MKLARISLPFDEEKTLQMIGWMKKTRNLKAVSIEKYLSGLRTLHIAADWNAPSLRSAMVKLVLKEMSNYDKVQDKI